MQRIEDAVNGVLEAMRQRGVSEYSLKCIRWSVYRRIVVWHHTHDMLSSMGTIRLFFFIHSRYKFFAIWQSQTEILLSPRKELIFIIARNIVSCVNSSDNVSSRDNESRKQYTVFPYS